MTSGSAGALSVGVSVHMRRGCPMTVRCYRAEGRAVVTVGSDRQCPHVDLYIDRAALVGFGDVLAAAVVDLDGGSAADDANDTSPEPQPRGNPDPPAALIRHIRPRAPSSTSLSSA
jgi:hypothetical protein